jgi:hypothetical protein
MTDKPWQKQLWDMAQRVGMQIAGMPVEAREAGFKIAEREVRAIAGQMGIAADKVEAFVALQMQVIRETTEKIDVGGSPQGGNA